MLRALVLLSVCAGCVEPICKPAEYGAVCGEPGTYTTCEVPDNTTCSNACWGPRDAHIVEKQCHPSTPICEQYERDGIPRVRCVDETLELRSYSQP